MSTHSPIGTAAMGEAVYGESPMVGVRPSVTLPARIALVLILLLASGLRLAMFVVGPAPDLTRAYEPDSTRYVELATNLSRFGVFGRAAENSGVVHVPLAQLRAEYGQLEAPDAHGLRPEIFRTPGYPLFVAMFQRLGFGVYGVLIGQALLGAVSVLIVCALGRCLFDATWPALLAGLILAGHPAAVVSSASVLSETLFTCMVLIGLWLVVRQTRVLLLVTAGGFIIGFAVLVRPVGILLGVAVVLWLIATERRWQVIAPALCLVIASLLPAACWMARNAKVGFGWQISSVLPINTLFYTVAYMQINEDGGDYAADWPATVNDLFVELRGQAGADESVFTAMNSLSASKIRSKPTLYAKVMARSAVKFMTDHSAGVLMTRLGRPYQPTGLRDRLLKGDWSFRDVPDRLGLVVAGAWTLWNLLLAGGMALGALMLVWRRRWSALLLLGGIIVYFVLTTQANGLERFRLPALGIQALLVASIFVPPLRGGNESSRVEAS